MPPRLPAGCTSQLVLRLEPNAPALQHAVAGAGRPSRPTLAPRSPSAPQQQSSCFSTTAPLEQTKPQRLFRSWLKTRGALHRDPPADDKPTYLGLTKDAVGSNGGYPFPSNREFRSQPVLSDQAREKIWSGVMVTGLPLKAVSAQFNVDMRRVAAVVRMKEIEKRWEKDGTPDAKIYAKAVMSMLPKADLTDEEDPFEPINDIHISSFTQQQLFVPAPESRQFTRRDAAKAFGDRILPVDEKLRIPELLKFEEDLAAGVHHTEARSKFVQSAADSEQKLAENKAAAEEKKASFMTSVQNDRFEFRIENINVNWAGPHGRNRGAIGWRYGVPHNDRRAGVVKIPTKVE